MTFLKSLVGGVDMNRVAYGIQKKTSHPLQLELQAVVSHLMWVVSV